MPRQHMRAGDVGREIDPDERARYHTTMKRSTVKLVFRRETLRLLTGMEIRLVEGANQSTGGAETGCVNALVDSAGGATGCPLVVK